MIIVNSIVWIVHDSDLNNNQNELINEENVTHNDY